MRREVGKKGGNGKREGKWEREAESMRPREDKKTRWKCKVGRQDGEGKVENNRGRSEGKTNAPTKNFTKLI